MEARDPYLLDPGLVADPPQSWLGRLRELGPGLVLTASIVGSGELIATTTLGAKAGFTALWVILLSCLVKVALQLEFGRHTIQTGETCLTALNRMPGPKFLNNHWTVWFWLAVQPLKVLQVGGIVGGVAIIMHMVCPAIPIAAWCWIAAIATAAIVALGRYRLIEQFCVVMVAGFTVATIVSVISLQWTPYALESVDVLDGLRGALPTGAMAVVIAAFGLTGVGGDEIMHYTYWLIEKGYAAKTGRRDAADPGWAERARGWIRLMYLDAFLSMAVYTVVTAAFYVLGAAVLHARGAAPKGYQMVETLAHMYTETLGGWAHGVFLLGAFFVLYSTLFSALAAWTRMFTDAAGHLRLIDFSELASRRRAVVCFAWVLPLAWAAIFLIVGEPVWMITVGGVATAAILLVVIVGAIHFRLNTAPELKPGWLYDAGLWLSIASIGSFAVYSGWKTVVDLSAPS
jgi:Mn2+/Fe2+ NRAMP family transporter